MLDPENTVSGVKRFIGRHYNEVFDLARSVFFPVAIGEGHLAVFPIRGWIYTPQEISALILKSLKESADAYFGYKIREAVVTVPAYFGDAQREATRQAAAIAGIEVKRLLVEPTAAAMAFGEFFYSRDLKIAVLDLGGGTFDATVLELTFIEGESQFEVLGVDGDGFLGGDDFDHRIEDWLNDELNDRYRVRPECDMAMRQRLVQTAVSAKEALSDAARAPILLPYLGQTGGDWMHLDTLLTRQAFDDLCAELFQRIEAPCRRVISRSGCSFADIDEVLMVGGATRISKVRTMAERLFGKTPRTLVNAQDAVVLGAARQAGILCGTVKDAILLDVLSHGLGVQTDEEVVLLIETATTFPTSAVQTFSTCRDG